MDHDIPEAACPHCHLVTPNHNPLCIHCGKRKEQQPAKVAKVRQQYFRFQQEKLVH